MPNTFHEKETISLKTVSDCSLAHLHDFLLSCGYRMEDDFYYLDRADTPKPWQSTSAVTVNVLKSGEGLNDLNLEGVGTSEPAWDELQIEYLLATLPAHYIDSTCNECERIARRFNLQISLEGKDLTATELRTRLRDIAKNLTIEWSEPGSETLAILIQDLYN